MQFELHAAQYSTHRVVPHKDSTATPAFAMQLGSMLASGEDGKPVSRPSSTAARRSFSMPPSATASSQAGCSAAGASTAGAAGTDDDARAAARDAALNAAMAQAKANPKPATNGLNGRDLVNNTLLQDGRLGSKQVDSLLCIAD